MFIGYLLKHLW